MNDQPPAPFPSAANPLALLGRLLQIAGDVAVTARQLVPACQAADPAFAARLEELAVRLEGVEQDIADACHPLLVRRIAEAQQPVPAKG